jgi:hypothetical protein
MKIKFEPKETTIAAIAKGQPFRWSDLLCIRLDVASVPIESDGEDDVIWVADLEDGGVFSLTHDSSVTPIAAHVVAEES